MNQDEENLIIGLFASHGCEELGTNIKSIYLRSFSRDPYILPKKLEVAIDDEWRQEVDKARTQGKEPLNNKFIQCLSYEVEIGTSPMSILRFDFSVTDWKHYNGIKKADPSKIIWGVGTAGITYFNNKEGERTYLFATRNLAKVSDIGGRLETPPAGFLDVSLFTEQSELYRQNNAIADNLKQEFEEEIGLSRDKIRSMNLLQVIRIPQTHDISIDYALQIETSEEELEESLKKSRKYSGEHAGHFFVPEHELCNFVLKHQTAFPPRTKCDLKNFLLKYEQQQ